MIWQTNIKSLKKGKATGIDAIQDEMLNVDFRVLCLFLNDMWGRKELPED